MTFKEWLNYPPYGLKIAKKVVIVFWILFLVMIISVFMQLGGLASLLGKLIYFPLSFFYAILSFFHLFNILLMGNIIGNIFFNFIFLTLFYFIFPILIFKAFEFFKGLSFLSNLPYWAKFGRNVVFVYWGCLILLAFISGYTISSFFILFYLNPYLFIIGTLSPIIANLLEGNFILLIIISIIGGTLFYFLLGAIIGKIVEFLSKI